MSIGVTLWNLLTDSSGHPSPEAGIPFFWATPVGFTVIFVIFLTSLCTIVSKRIKTDLVCDIYNWVLAGVCFIAMLHVMENSNPHYQLQIILFALAAHKVWVVAKSFRGYPQCL